MFISYIEPAILEGRFVPGTGRLPPGVTVNYDVGFAVGPMERDEATTAREEALAEGRGALPPLQQSGGPRLEVDTQDPTRLTSITIPIHSVPLAVYCVPLIV